MYDEMAGYVVHWVVHFQKGLDAYLESQRTATWQPVEYSTADNYPISILGFGQIGKRIGRALSDLGFPVNAWSRSGSNESWATAYAGTDQLPACLSSAAAVVNVLPSTAETHKLMSATRFSQCRRGALFINLGRGTTVDEAALIEALDSGQIGAAVLDVTDPEPMAPSNPLWTHPRARITPHVAGYTLVAPATKVIAANIRRIVDGDEPFPLLERSRNY
jgi:glyoxylate/hydroxypyruvate reductase A